jgi:hypothetical protein
MNLLVTREPDMVCWSDACPLGIGGYSLSGRAWRLRIPDTSPHHGHKGINNLLEFLGMAINIWLSCLEAGGNENCILAIGDNTSALGWLHNSSRLDIEGEAHRAHLKVARKIATLLTENQCCLASQHLNGDLNVVADLLSFEDSDRGKNHPIAFDKPANDELSSRFLTHYPSQIPENFAISQLPTDTILVHASATNHRVIFDSQQESSNESFDRTWRRWRGYCKHVGYSTDPHLTKLSVNERSLFIRAFLDFYRQAAWDPVVDFWGRVASQWSRALCGKPQATWLRRFGTISGSAPCTSRDQRTCDPSSEPGCRLAKTSTHPNDNNEQ